MTYGQWRQMHRGDPAALEAVGFKDDPEKDKEELRLEIEAAPGWAPGRSMKPGRAAVRWRCCRRGLAKAGTPPEEGQSAAPLGRANPEQPRMKALDGNVVCGEVTPFP